MYCVLKLGDVDILQIRIFSYAVGPTANPVSAARWIACSNRGIVKPPESK